MKVKFDKLPQTEGIKNALPSVDFTDTFSTTNHQDEIREVSKLVFGTMPRWVRFLMSVRNRIVRLFGLKTEKPKDFNDNFKIGGYIGFFKIFSIEPHEVILGADDKHLKFRVSILISNEGQFNIKVTTLVQYVNRFGKVYMTVIKPFHYLVVKRMVRQAYKR